MTKKDGVWLNGRIELWQKKMKFEWMVKYYWIETEKDEGPTNGRLGFGFLHLYFITDVIHNYDKKRWGLSKRYNKIGQKKMHIWGTVD